MSVTSPTKSLPASLVKNPPPSLILAARAELELRRRRRQRQIDAWRSDPDALCAALAITPDPWQRDILTTTQDAHLCCGRQVGKTEALALVLVRALLEPDTLNLIVSPSERQSREVYRRVLGLYRRLARPVPYRSVNLSSLELENGARLLALPGSQHTVRGLANVALLVIDEAAYVEDELAAALFPMLAVSQGRLVTASTPAGQRGWWYQQIQSRDQGSLYIEVPSVQCPRISAPWLERERARIGEWWFAQEFECRFMEPQTAAFREADIQRSLTDDVHFDADLFRD